MAEVGRVTAEQLVRALAREHDLHVLPRRLREQIRGQDRRIPHRLGERAGHQLEGPLQGGVVRRDDVMRRADVAGGRQGVFAFVLTGGLRTPRIWGMLSASTAPVPRTPDSTYDTSPL